MAAKLNALSFREVAGFLINNNHTDTNTGADGIYIAQYSEVLLVGQVGAITTTLTSSNFIRCHGQVSDTGRARTWTDIPQSDIEGGTGSSGDLFRINSAHTSTTVHFATYRGDRAFLRLRIDFGGRVSEDFPFSCFVIGTKRDTPGVLDIEV